MDSVRALADADAERAWVATFLGAVAAFVVGSLLFPRVVYDRFLWQYFWGPVEADAHGARGAVLREDGVELLDTTCEAVASGAVCAEPGYTTVSTVSYVVVLVFMLWGVYLLGQRWSLGRAVTLYYALVPFMLLGGALRTVEDAFDAARAAGETVPIGYPANTLLISPLIYVVIFLITFAALILAMGLEERGVIDDFRTALGAAGVGALAITLGYLTYLGLTRPYTTLYPQMALVVVGLATVLAYGLWRVLLARYPDPVAATEYAGAFVIWGHAIDGVANVVTADWLGAIGVVDATGQPLEYFPKHVANRIIVDVTETVQPAALSEVIGTSWPFLVVKLAVASAVLWLFTEEFMEDSTRYALLLLIAITAVGLGPGTRDLLRVTFGI
jgi:uncharacterized membrane protein